MGGNMNIYTSYFARVKKLQEMGLNNLWCVAGYAPKFFFDLDNAHFYPDLAPRRDWWLKWHNKFKDNPNSPEAVEWYKDKYINTVLNKVNPNEVLRKLGDNAVMLCYEKVGDFCHRHLIADWLMRNTNAKVQEVQL